MTEIRQFKYHAYSMVVEKFSRLGIGLLATVLLARALGPSAFGDLSYVLALIAIMMVLSSAGLEKIVIKELVAGPDRANVLVGSSAVIALTSSLVGYALVVLTAALSGLKGVPFIYAAVLGMTVVFRSSNIIKFYFEAKEQAYFSSTASVVGSLCFLFTIFFLIVQQKPVVWYFLPFILDACVSTIFLLFFYITKKTESFRLTFNGDVCRELIQKSFPLFLAAGLYVIYTRVDQLMIGLLYTSEEVGFYSIAVKLSEGWLAVPIVIAAAYYPKLIIQIKNNVELKDSIAENLLRLFTVFIYIVILLLYFFGLDLVALVFSEKFKDVATILVVHSVGGLFVVSGIISMRVLLVRDMQKTSMYRGLIGLVVNVIINLIAIPKYGALGAAWATVFSQFVALYASNFVNPKTRDVFYLQTRALSPVGFFSSCSNLYRSTQK